MQNTQLLGPFCPNLCKNYVYRDKDCMKKFCDSLEEHALKITNFEEKKMILLTKRLNHMLDKKTVTFAKESLKTNRLVSRKGQ